MRKLLAIIVFAAACGDNLAPVTPDAITVGPPGPPPVACLDCDAGNLCGSPTPPLDCPPVDAAIVVTWDHQDGGATVPPWHLDAGIDAP